jgi:hypothetical protein
MRTTWTGSRPGSDPPRVERSQSTVPSLTRVGSAYDVVKGVFVRLGMVGAILLASALIFVAIAGGVVVHRLQSAPAASGTQQRGDNAVEQGEGQSKETPPKHAASASPEPGDSQDKDA